VVYTLPLNPKRLIADDAYWLEAWKRGFLTIDERAARDKRQF
jgi:hypothetical protein